MAANTSHTPDGRGVLIYNGEMILLYTKQVNLTFEQPADVSFKGKKTGTLYLTSHRMIFTNGDGRERLQSFCWPFHCLRDVKLEQPILGANYLHGEVLAQPGGNWEGSMGWRLTFNKGGCIDYGQALLRAVSLAGRYQPYTEPPPYAPPPGSFFSPPPAYYTAPQQDVYQSCVGPARNAFPDAPPPADVFMYESPPPYGGIGPAPPPHPAGPPVGGAPQPPPADAPPAYDHAVANGVRLGKQ